MYRTRIDAGPLAAIALVLLQLPVATGTPLATPSNTLFYAQPATNWEKDGLPIGNGSIGAVLFGGPERAEIQSAGVLG